MTIQIHVKYDNGEAVEAILPMRLVSQGQWQLPQLAWDRIVEATIKPIAEPTTRMGSTLKERIERLMEGGYGRH